MKNLITPKFRSVSIAALLLISPALASAWTAADIGSAAGGSSSYNSGTGVYSITGAGADIWGFNDAFQFYYQTLNGDGTIIAKVLTVQNTSAWSKAGIMIRADLTSSAANAMMCSSPTGGGAASYMWRPTASTAANATTNYSNPVPIWYKLQRTGSVVAGFTSTDGVTWTPVDSRTITLPTVVYVGLVQCSNVSGTPGTSTMSNVSVTPASLAPLTPFSWGSVIPSGTGYLDHAINMFNVQPTWNGTAPTSPTDSNGNDYITAPWDGNATAYIDLGVGWRTWRIQQTWTQYLVGRNSSPAPFTSVWWDSSPNSTPGGTSITETLINFNSQTHTTAGAWVRDGFFSTPIVPQGRYLMMKTGTPTADPCEFAFIGYKDLSGTNYPPIVSAGANQSVQWTAHLVATANDDGIPSPPSALTYTWSKVTGPGTVNFVAANAAVTDASFSAAGTYQLRVTVNDNGTTGLSASSTLNVTVAKATTSLTLPEVKAFNYSTLTLVDEVLCDGVHDTASSAHPLIESAAGVSAVQTILGRQCRVLLNQPGSLPSYFAYRLGVGKNLQANKAYILVVEYPEDQPRVTILMNRGCETTRTFHTGVTLGDPFFNPYTPTNASSMHFSLSQQYRSAEMLFHLHSHFPGVLQPLDNEFPRDNTPSGGFLALIGQFSHDNIPMSAGAAAARVALYEAPASWTTYSQQVTLPPNNLPKRHLFWREEISDGELDKNGGVDNDIDWYEWKAQLAKFLGMNTYSKDLLEFGYNQGFSSAKYYPGYLAPIFSWRWEQIIYRLTGGSTAAPNGYGLDFLPYYEYAGTDGGENSGTLGRQKLAKPLVGINSGKDYTGIWWSEFMDVDITDPATTTDIQHLLDSTITSLSGAGGGRPVQQTVVGYGRLGAFDAGKWGYVDLGTNFANLRITQCWTRSLAAAGGPATPEIGVYWSSTLTGFSGSTVPSGAVADTHINFVTQTQSSEESFWTRDMNLSQANAIIPPKRYLVMRAANTPQPSQANQFLLVGWDASVSPVKIKTLPIAAAGSIDGHDLSIMFNEQAPFNSNTASFVGAWIRQRPSEIPIGFGDATLARFATEANGGTAVTRTQLSNNPTLLQSYYNWWNNKRKAFFNGTRDYLRANVAANAVVLYTWDPNEEGSHLPDANGMVTDDTASWSNLITTMGYKPALDYQTTISTHAQQTSMLLPFSMFPDPSGGQQENNHSMPKADPLNYTTNDGVLMTHTFNKAYTAADPTSWSTFRTASGVAAIRHYCLNEDSMKSGADWSGASIVGKFVTDADPAGPYCMIGEALALANGDPYYIGYLSSNSFNRLSPGYVRDFDANYLSLPAMTSTIVSGAASDSEVVVRKIVTPSNGTWLAIVNTGLSDKIGVQVTPGVAGTVTDAVTGATITLTSGKIVLDMWPARLKCVHIQ